MNVKLSALSRANLGKGGGGKEDEMHIKVKAGAFNGETISSVACRVGTARQRAAIFPSKSRRSDQSSLSTVGLISVILFSDFRPRPS